jgi:hypothetical protein
VARYSADSVFTVGGRERLFDPGFREPLNWSDWDIAPSGDRFLMVFPPASGGYRIIQVQNLWSALEGGVER